MGGCDHFACLEGDVDEEVVDFLEIEICHLDGISHFSILNNFLQLNCVYVHTKDKVSRNFEF